MDLFWICRDDDECWTYCDHMEWHDTEFNASEFSQDHLLEEQVECLATCTILHVLIFWNSLNRITINFRTSANI